MPDYGQCWHPADGTIVVAELDSANGEGGAVVWPLGHHFQTSVDKENMIQLCARRFTALVRWRCEAVPELELETQQAGFESAEEAALAANGLGHQAFDEVLVERNEVTVLRDGTAQDGRCLTIFGWVSVGSDFPGVPREWAFERTERITEHATAIAPGERFARYAFRVVDELSGEDISVDFLITPGGVRLLVARAGTRTAQSSLVFT